MCNMPKFGYDEQGFTTFNGETYPYLSAGMTEEGLRRAANYVEWLNNKLTFCPQYARAIALAPRDHDPYILCHDDKEALSGQAILTLLNQYEARIDRLATNDAEDFEGFLQWLEDEHGYRQIIAADAMLVIEPEKEHWHIGVGHCPICGHNGSTELAEVGADCTGQCHPGQHQGSPYRARNKETQS